MGASGRAPPTPGDKALGPCGDDPAWAGLIADKEARGGDCGQKDWKSTPETMDEAVERCSTRVRGRRWTDNLKGKRNKGPGARRKSPGVYANATQSPSTCQQAPGELQASSLVAMDGQGILEAAASTADGGWLLAGLRDEDGG